MSAGNAIMQPSNLIHEGPLFAASRAPQPGTRTGYFGVGDFFRILRRRWILIATITAIGVLLTTIVLINITPIYSSSAKVVVQPPDTDISFATPTAVLNPNQEADIETKVEMLQSRRLARRAATTLQLDNDPEFAPPAQERHKLTRWFRDLLIASPPPETDPALRAKDAERLRREAVADRLLDKVQVDRIGRSSTIEVTASSRDPEKAALIANRIVDTYINGQVSNAREQRDRTIQSLTQQVAQVRAEMQQADGAAATYRARKGLLASTPEAQGAMQVAQSAGILAQTQADRAFETRRAQLNGQAATSPLLNDLRQQETILNRKLSELTAVYGAGYPDVAKTKAELATLAPRIAIETNRVAAEMQAQASAAQARSGAVSATIAGLRSQALTSSVDAVPLKGLERQAQSTNELYQSLVTALNAKIATPLKTDSDLSFISRASIPSVPSYPIPQRILVVALLAFLLLGVIAAFVVDTMDTTIRTAAQVKRLLGIPTLAMVPDMRGDGDGGPVHELVESKPRSRFAEAMRNLLIELESRHGQGPHVVLVTSPLDGEGKSTIATSLASAASIVGRRAVVVDFDLRRPDIQPAGPKSTGVVGYLSGKAGMEDLPVIQQGSHFATIAVVDTPVDPGSLIASPRLPMMIDTLRRHYDFVILNAPPILPVRDAKTLTDYADSTLLVMRWGYTNPEAARVAMEMFERPIAGAVINMVDYPAHARRRYGDAIHHITNLTAYYDADDIGAGLSWGDRARRSLRRSRRRVAEVLHFN